VFKAVEERDYPDYDYLDNEEAIYQGYDAEGDSDYSVGFTVYEPEQKTETREDPEKNNGDKESRDSEADENRDSEVDESTDDDDIWLDGDEDINENEEPDDQLMIDDSEADADEEAWYEDEESESGEKVSPESYVIDGHEYDYFIVMKHKNKYYAADPLAGWAWDVVELTPEKALRIFALFNFYARNKGNIHSSEIVERQDLFARSIAIEDEAPLMGIYYSDSASHQFENYSALSYFTVFPKLRIITLSENR